IMESYWPNAAEKPYASKHDIEHANWVTNAQKIVFSNTLKKTKWTNSTIFNGDINKKLSELKSKSGKNMLMMGSADAVHTLMKDCLIDEFFINVNPVILGNGIPLFKDIYNAVNLKLISSVTLKSGVVGLHYETVR